MRDRLTIQHNDITFDLFKPNIDEVLKGGYEMYCNKKLSEYVSSHGITQKFLCDKTGITSEKMSYILNCKRKITGDELLKFCDVLGLDLDYFKA